MRSSNSDLMQKDKFIEKELKLAAQELNKALCPKFIVKAPIDIYGWEWFESNYVLSNRFHVNESNRAKAVKALQDKARELKVIIFGDLKNSYTAHWMKSFNYFVVGAATAEAEHKIEGTIIHLSWLGKKSTADWEVDHCRR